MMKRFFHSYSKAVLLANSHDLLAGIGPFIFDQRLKEATIIFLGLLVIFTAQYFYKAVEG